jgi:hypothetical protein
VPAINNNDNGDSLSNSRKHVIEYANDSFSNDRKHVIAYADDHFNRDRMVDLRDQAESAVRTARVDSGVSEPGRRRSGDTSGRQP